MARFSGKGVLISGDARGQGAAEARQLLAAGASVVIGDVLVPDGRVSPPNSALPRVSSATM